MKSATVTLTEAEWGRVRRAVMEMQSKERMLAIQNPRLTTIIADEILALHDKIDKQTQQHLMHE